MILKFCSNWNTFKRAQQKKSRLLGCLHFLSHDCPSGLLWETDIDAIIRDIKTAMEIKMIESGQKLNIKRVSDDNMKMSKNWQKLQIHTRPEQSWYFLTWILGYDSTWVTRPLWEVRFFEKIIFFYFLVPQKTSKTFWSELQFWSYRFWSNHILEKLARNISKTIAQVKKF